MIRHGVERTKEAHRDGWGVRWLSELVADARYAFRHLHHSPGFAAAAILTLALGIGANTAMFSVLNALVLRSLPVKDPDGLISILGRNQDGGVSGTPIPVVGELAKDGPLRDVCGYNDGLGMYPRSVEVNGLSLEAVVAYVTGRCFETFGVRPILGRPITDADAPLMAPGNRVAVISYRFWKRAFGANPDALGRMVSANGIALRIIGILPPDFGGLDVDAGDDLFVPFDTIVPVSNDRRPFAAEILGRLRPRVSFEQATAQIDARWHAFLEPFMPPRCRRTYVPLFYRCVYRSRKSAEVGQLIARSILIQSR